MFVKRLLLALVPAFIFVGAGSSFACAQVQAHGPACDPATVRSYRARADALYDRAQYNAAGNAFAAAARLEQRCASRTAPLDAAVLLARAGGAFGEAGNTDLGLTQLRRAQGLLASIVAKHPRDAPDARDYLATVTTTINSIDSQFM